MTFQACDCNKVGTHECTSNGECVCKQNVIGYNCATCKENMWGFNQGDGCKECNCNQIGSVSLQCDANTGQCKCKTGVTGQRCDQCEPDHWNYTSNGCQKCECQRDGVRITETGGYACDSKTGHCTCIEGVKGIRCDQCDDRWVLVKHVGCKKCDTCVNTLLDDVEELFLKTNEIENGNKNYSLTFKAHNKLTKLEEEFNTVKASVDPSQYEIMPLISLRRNIKNVQDDLTSLKQVAEYDVNDKIKTLTRLLNDAELFNKDVGSLNFKLSLLDQIIEEFEKEEYKVHTNISNEQVDYYESIVDQIVKRELSIAVEKHRELVEQFKKGKQSNLINRRISLLISFNCLFSKANETVQTLRSNFDKHSNEIESIKNKNTYIQKSLIEMKHLIDKAKNFDRFKDRDIEFKAYFDNLEQIKNETISLQSNSAAALSSIEKIYKQGQLKLDVRNIFLIVSCKFCLCKYVLF